MKRSPSRMEILKVNRRPSADPGLLPPGFRASGTGGIVSLVLSVVSVSVTLGDAILQGIIRWKNKLQKIGNFEMILPC